MSNEEIIAIAISDWREELAGLTDEQILVGISNLPKSWPPTSGEFRDLCEEKPDAKHNTAAYLPLIKQKQLEAPKDKKLARKELAKAKRILKGNRNIDRVTA